MNPITQTYNYDTNKINQQQSRNYGEQRDFLALGLEHTSETDLWHNLPDTHTEILDDETRFYFELPFGVSIENMSGNGITVRGNVPAPNPQNSYYSGEPIAKVDADFLKMIRAAISATNDHNETPKIEDSSDDHIERKKAFDDYIRNYNAEDFESVDKSDRYFQDAEKEATENDSKSNIRFPTWGEIRRQSENEAENIISSFQRGSLVVIISNDNQNSTVARNSAVASASGIDFLNLTKPDKPRRVMFANSKTPPKRLYREISKMFDALPDSSKALVDENLHIETSLNLPAELEIVKNLAERTQPDLIVLDVGELSDTALEELANLAESLDCIILLAQTGKAIEESAFDVIQLTTKESKSSETVVTIEIDSEKVEARFNRISGWLESNNANQLYSRTIALIDKPMATAEILRKRGLSKSTVEEHLRRGISENLIEKVGRGLYQPIAANHNN